MVTTENGNSVREADFKRNEQRHCLNTVVATINVITHEQVVCIRGLSTNLEQFTQVMELAVNITANRHRCAHLLHVRLIDQNFLSLHTEEAHLDIADVKLKVHLPCRRAC